MKGLSEGQEQLHLLPPVVEMISPLRDKEHGGEQNNHKKIVNFSERKFN